MSKRKAANPVRMTDGERTQLSWNLGETSTTSISQDVELDEREELNEIQEYEPAQNGSSDKSESVNENNTSNSLPSSLESSVNTSAPKKRRKKKIDENLQSRINECDFYVHVNRTDDGNNENYVGEIGSCEIKVVDSERIDFPQTPQCWLYVSQISDRSLLYFEWSNSENVSSNSNINTERQFKYYSLNLCSTPYELLRALHRRKYFELHMNDCALPSQNILFIRIYLMAATLMDHQVSVSMNLGNIRQEIQTVMKFLCGISNPDYTTSVLKRQNINDLYESVLKIHRLEEIKCPISVQHTGLKPTLRPYQVEAVKWMLKQENFDDVLLNRKLDTKELHVLYEEIKLKNGIKLYYNRFGGMFVKTKPLKQPKLPGGILADEMGLGKTIEVLACILCHPRPNKPIAQQQAQTSDIFFHDNKETNQHSKNRCYWDISKLESCFECVCGEFDDENSEEEKVQCIKCGLWQHSLCVKYEKCEGNNYFCPHCLVTQPPIQSRATLIVSPASIIHQWVEEIHKHIHSKRLRLLIYTGVNSMGFVQPSTLADNDIVLTTYATLRREFSYVDLPHTNSDNQRRFRHPKRFMAIPSPLVAVEWWRICLDEAQMVESPTAKTAEMALRLLSINRWCITGTPIQKSVNDLYGLLLFLGMDPYSVQVWWNKCLLKPYQYGDREPLNNVIGNVLWRTAKKDVLDQINIPEQNDCIHWLNFTPVEEHFYRMQHVECSRTMVLQLNRFTDDSLRLNSIDRHELSNLLTPLLRLRQACCHPQVVRGHMLPIHKNTMTMEELLQSLIKKAKMDSERAHRGLVASLNGLAAIHIIKEEWAEAVEKYREVLRSIEELKPKIKTDKLQKIHTLHNLNEVLSAGHPNIPPTLRDSSLIEEAKQIEKIFLEKFKLKVRDSRDVLKTTSIAVEELRNKMDDNSTWWMNILNWARTTERGVDVIQRVQNELVDHSHSKVLGSSIKNKFHDINGLSYILTNRVDDLHKAHLKLNQAVQNLKDEPSAHDIRSTVECHLRVSKKKVPKCIYCQVDDLFNRYESRLFSINENRPGEQPEKQTEEDALNLLGPLRRGNWADSETEKAIKAIFSFGKNFNVNRMWLDAGQIHLKYFEALKKDFRGLRGVWMQLRDQASAIDELSQATIRLSLRFDNEPKNNESAPAGTIAHYEVEQHKAQLLTSVTVERNELQKKLGQLHYLTNLSKSDYGRRGGSNPELCPICQHALGEKWTVLICGHCFCMECFQVLMTSASRFGGPRWKLKCPVCRQHTQNIEISYVSTKRETTLDDKIEVKGSHSTKVEAVVRQLLEIKNNDSTAKSIVFSTWQNVLDVLMNAFGENNIGFTVFSTGTRSQKNLNRFKSDPNTNVLLLLVQSGANGLNIIEATHVLLVEPILNPASELQAIGRIHRIGQTQRTYVHRFIVRGTIEERMHNSPKLHSNSSNHYSTDENTVTLGNLKELFISEPLIENDNE